LRARAVREKFTSFGSRSINFVTTATESYNHDQVTEKVPPKFPLLRIKVINSFFINLTIKTTGIWFLRYSEPVSIKSYKNSCN